MNDVSVEIALTNEADQIHLTFVPVMLTIKFHR